MNDLRAIISSALLGTERSPLGTLEHPALEKARVNLEDQRHTGQLLGVAALAFAMTRAGEQTNANSKPLTPAEPDTRVRISEAAMQRLDLLFASATELIPEWLELVKQSNYAIPHSHIIALLDYGRQNTASRETIMPILDSRGRWLAQQNPYWSWATGNTSSLENALETWETGTKAARVLAFRSIRTEQPDTARDLLQSVWKAEVAEERKTFLSELESKLTDADEPFLETCLDDRSKDVRSIAAMLLAKLPNSALVQRMIARGQNILSIPLKKSALKLGAPEFEIELPEWNTELGRDGIEKKTPYGTGGDKAYWLQSIIANIPISTWQPHFHLEPKEIIKRLPKDWRKNLLIAFVQANEIHPNPEWIDALLSYDNDLIKNETLMKTLSLEQREKRVRYFIFAKQTHDFQWLAWMNHAWNIEFSRDCLEWLGNISKQILKGTSNYHNIQNIAQYCHPDIIQHWHNPTKHPNWTSFLEQTNQFNPEKNNRAWYIQHHLEQIKTLISHLETRNAMRKELQP